MLKIWEKHTYSSSYNHYKDQAYIVLNEIYWENLMSSQLLESMFLWIYKQERMPIKRGYLNCSIKYWNKLIFKNNLIGEYWRKEEFTQIITLLHEYVDL